MSCTKNTTDLPFVGTQITKRQRRDGEEGYIFKPTFYYIRYIYDEIQEEGRQYKLNTHEDARFAAQNKPS